MEWEDYLIEDSKILKNKFNIKDLNKLSKLENSIVVTKLAYLHDYGMDEEFDSNHLCKLHEFLFSDVYEFAGKYREVDMFKKYGGFTEYQLIDSEVERITNEYKNKEILVSSVFDIAKFLADYYYELIMIHPFREGNGRTIREFIRQFTSYKFPGYTIDFTKMNKNNLLLGVVDRETYPLLLAFEINNTLTYNNTKKM